MVDRVSRIIAFLLFGLLAVCGAGCTSNSGGAISVISPSPSAKVRDGEISRVYTLARRKDLSGLLAIGVPIATALPTSMPKAAGGPVLLIVPASAEPTPIVTPSIGNASPTALPAATIASLTSVVALALFVVDKKKYAANYIVHYPVDQRGVMNDYGVAFARAHIENTGDVFPIAALGALAVTGSDDAFAKLLRATNSADGAIAETYRGQIGHVLAGEAPATTFRVLTSLSPAEQLASISTIGACGNAITALLKFEPASAPANAPFAERVHTLQAALSQAASDDCLTRRRTAQPHVRHIRSLPHVRVRPTPKR